MMVEEDFYLFSFMFNGFFLYFEIFGKLENLIFIFLYGGLGSDY